MIASAQALWWLALPVLLLPIWWHRKKRQRIKSEALATARFLPSAPPQQLRVWRWDDPVLLLVRCLLLVALIAWLASVTMPWRGDTVLIDPALEGGIDVSGGTSRTSANGGTSSNRGTSGNGNGDTSGSGGNGGAWAAQQIAAAGLTGAQRMPLPADALPWLQAHEHEWRPGARLLIVATATAMPAQLPRLAHSVDIRILPASTADAVPAASADAASGRTGAAATAPAAASSGAAAASQAGASAAAPATASSGATAARAAGAAAAAPVTASSGATAAHPAGGVAPAPAVAQSSHIPAEHHIALATTPSRAPAWRALFAAFDAAGSGAHRYVLSETPGARTELIVWDKPEAMPSSWRAPLWWVTATSIAPELAAAKPLTVNGIPLTIADTPRGRVWVSAAWPPKDADSAAALYETWQALSRPAPPYAAPSMFLPAQRATPLAMPGTPPAEWLAYALLALFALERILTHARRR